MFNHESKESQNKRMIKELTKRRVKNYEFAKMYIMSYTKRLSEIRQSHNLHKERVYDKHGKATGVFEYWITEDQLRQMDKVN